MGSNPLSGIDSFGLDYFGISIDYPATTIDGNTLDLGIDTGHVFAWLKDDDRKVKSIYSFGPNPGIGLTNIIPFLIKGSNGASKYPIDPKVKKVRSWAWYLQNGNVCKKQFDLYESSSIKYSMNEQCTSKSIELAKACGISLPNGISKVKALSGLYSTQISNPAGLAWQIGAIKDYTIENSSIYKKVLRQ